MPRQSIEASAGDAAGRAGSSCYHPQMSSPTAEDATTLKTTAAAPSSGDRSVPSARTVGTIAAIVAMVTVVDQLTKALVVARLGPGEEAQRRELLGRFLALEYVENTGAAFGFLAGRVWLLSILALVIVIWFLIAYWRRVPGRLLLQVAVSLVLGGAVGNLIDRIRLGYVVDFLAIGWWPRFNVADSAITLGLGLLFLAVLRDDATVRDSA